jgi:hypothetical protein
VILVDPIRCPQQSGQDCKNHYVWLNAERLLVMLFRRTIGYLIGGSTQFRTAISQALVDDLSLALKGRVTTSPAVLQTHGKDEGWHESKPPDAVCFPTTTEEVSKVGTPDQCCCPECIKYDASFH